MKPAFCALLCCLPLLLTAGVPLALLALETASDWNRLWASQDLNRLGAVLLRSCVVSLSVALACTALAFPLARLITRRRWACTSVLRYSFLLPLLIPLTLHTGAWIFIGIGRSSSILPGLPDTGLGLGALQSVIWIWTVALTPLAVILLSTAMVTCNRSGEEAASLIPLRGIDRLRITTGWYRVPLLCSVLAITLMTLNSHTVPSFFGEHFYAEEILTAFLSDFSPTGAAALSSLLLPVLLLLLISLTLLIRKLPDHTSLAASPSRSTRPPSMPERMLLTLGVLIMVLAPLAVLLREAGWMERFLPVARLASPAIGASILTATGAGIVALLIGIPLAAAAFFLRRRPAAVLLIDLLATTPLVLPHALTAAGLILFWNHGDWRDSLYTSGLPHPLGLGIIFSTLPYWAVRYGMRVLPERYSQAAGLAGIPDARRFTMIELRICRHWILTALAAVMIVSMMELEASMLLYSPGRMTLPVRIYNLLHYGRDADMATMCLIMILMVLLPAVILRTILVRRKTTHAHHA